MYLDDLKEGMEFDIPTVTIDKERMLDFARLYDPIPLHLDEEYAKSTRFGQLIAPGVMTFMSVWAEFVKLGVFGEQLIAGMSTKIEWFQPVHAGDVLHGVARMTRIERRNAYNGIAEVTVDIFNQKGEMVIRDVTESVVRYKSQNEG